MFEAGLALDTDLAFDADLVLLLFRGFFVSAAGAADVVSAFGAIGVTAGIAAVETGSAAFTSFIFLRIAFFRTRFFFVFSSISQLPLCADLNFAYSNPVARPVNQKSPSE